MKLKGYKLTSSNSKNIQYALELNHEENEKIIDYNYQIEKKKNKIMKIKEK